MSRRKPPNTPRVVTPWFQASDVVFTRPIRRALGEEIFGVTAKEQVYNAKAIGQYVGLFVKVDGVKWVITANELRVTNACSGAKLDEILGGTHEKLRLTDADDTKTLLILREDLQENPCEQSLNAGTAGAFVEDEHDENHEPNAETTPWVLRILGPTEPVAEAKKIVEDVMLTIAQSVPIGVIIMLELGRMLGKRDLGKQMNVVFVPQQETSAEGTVLVVGRADERKAAVNLLESMASGELATDDGELSVNFLLNGNKVNETFAVECVLIPALKAKWMSGYDLLPPDDFGARAEKKRFERPDGVFMRFTEDWRKLSATFRVILAARTAIALEEAVAKLKGVEHSTIATQQDISALVDECEVGTEEGVSAEAAEFIFGHHKAENIRNLAETTNTLIYRRHRQDTAFHLAGRRADIDSVKSRFQQVKHIVVSFYNISFIGSSYVASVRYEYESEILQIHCKPEQEYRSGRAELRLLYNKGEVQADGGSAEQAFLSAMEFLDIYELVLQGPSWLSNVADASFITAFKSAVAYNVHTLVTTKPIDDTVLLVFSGKRNATLAVYREFTKKLKKSGYSACDVFVREVAEEDSSAFLDPSLPVDGDPTDNVLRSELDETNEESYYWNRLTGRRWRLCNE